MTLKKSAWAAAIAATLAVTSFSAHADKREVTQKILASQQGSVEDMARMVAERPARQLAAAANQVVFQAVPEDKREATVKLVDAELKKYMDAALPLVRNSGNKLSTSVLAPIYEEQFSEDELKQLHAMLTSPVLKRYQTLLPSMGNALLEKVAQDASPQVDPKLKTAEANIRKILDNATGGKLSQGAAAKPAAPAKK